MIVDLFAGPGGLDTAALDLDQDVIGLELSPNACATRRAAGLNTVQCDVRAYGPEDFPDARILAGGPPCQTFSGAGKGIGRLLLAQLQQQATDMAMGLKPMTGLDERSALVLEPLRWALAAKDLNRPYQAIVLEQVPAVLPMWRTYVEILTAEGYTAVCGVLNAEEYGVPQTRKRAVLLASLDQEVALPTPTHRPYLKSLPQAQGNPWLLPWKSMGEVLPDRGPFTVVSNYGSGGDPANRGRRTSDKPAYTVTGKVNRNRVLDTDGNELPRFTQAEAGVLQGFPANYPWSGGNVWQQIGDSMPIGLGRAVLAAVLTTTSGLDGAI